MMYKGTQSCEYNKKKNGAGNEQMYRNISLLYFETNLTHTMQMQILFHNMVFIIYPGKVEGDRVDNPIRLLPTYEDMEGGIDCKGRNVLLEIAKFHTRFHEIVESVQIVVVSVGNKPKITNSKAYHKCIHWSKVSYGVLLLIAVKVCML